MGLLLYSCMIEKNHLTCLNAVIKKQSQELIYDEVLKSLKDTIQSWSNRNLKFADHNHHEWKIEALVFNQERNKILSWILIKENTNEKYDNIDLISGEKLSNNKWNFYSVTMATYSSC